MLYFFDTSALVKQYHPETGSAIINEIFASSEHQILITSLSMVEFVSATNKIKNRGYITLPQFGISIDKFTSDISSGRISVVDVHRTHILESYKLIVEYKLTPVDAIILAAAVELREFDPIFVCADIRSGLMHAAEACHLSTLNPLSA